MITCSLIAPVSRSTPALRLPRFFYAFCKYKQKDRPATNRGIFEMKIENDLLKASFTSPRRIAIGIGFLIVIDRSPQQMPSLGMIERLSV